MPDHCYQCFWNDNCQLFSEEPTEEEYEEAESCGEWLTKVA